MTMQTPYDTLPPQSDPVPPKPPRKKRRIAGAAVAAVAAVALGTGTYVVVHRGDDSSSSSTAAGAQGGPGGAGGAGTGAPPSGTVVSTTSTTITVKLSTGTKTYTLASNATVEKDGATSSLSALTAGEKVVVLTGRPGSTSTTVSRVLAGTSATAGPGGAGGGQPPAGNAAA